MDPSKPQRLTSSQPPVILNLGPVDPAATMQQPSSTAGFSFQLPVGTVLKPPDSSGGGSGDLFELDETAVLMPSANPGSASVVIHHSQVTDAPPVQYTLIEGPEGEGFLVPTSETPAQPPPPTGK